MLAGAAGGGRGDRQLFFSGRREEKEVEKEALPTHTVHRNFDAPRGMNTLHVVFAIYYVWSMWGSSGAVHSQHSNLQVLPDQMIGNCSATAQGYVLQRVAIMFGVVQRVCWSGEEKRGKKKQDG